MKAITKFSGGGGVDLGMIAAGWEHTYGIEYDDRIAQVARNNGLNTITADILAIKPEDYPGMDWMHDSPPCPNFSTAKANREETENDIALARAVCDWIAYHRPQYYTLENVYGYRLSKSWAMIANTLNRHGYSFNYWHVNMADYGVPQTRKRMIVIARLGGKTPHLPKKTHDENPVPGLFGALKRWVSWFDAVEDLIPTLKKRDLPQRLKKIKGCDYNKCLLINVQNTTPTGTRGERKVRTVARHRPAFTVIASSYKKRSLPIMANDMGDFYQTDIRCSARFQSFPDWYDVGDAGEIIGNAVPPLFMQRVGEMFASEMEAL